MVNIPLNERFDITGGVLNGTSIVGFSNFFGLSKVQHQVQGATLGIVGLGRIGTLVTKRVQGLGMKVLAYDPYLSKNRAEDLKVELYDNLKQMLVKCDFLTVHTPLTEETLGMIGRDELACLPSHAIVVNAARGGIIQEDALADSKHKQNRIPIRKRFNRRISARRKIIGKI